MTKTVVWKYKLPLIDGVSVLPLPEGAEILTCAGHGLDLLLWARLNPDKLLTKERKFIVLGTGKVTTEPRLKFICTVFILIDVYHVFEVLA